MLIGLTFIFSIQERGRDKKLYTVVIFNKVRLALVSIAVMIHPADNLISLPSDVYTLLTIVYWLDVNKVRGKIQQDCCKKILCHRKVSVLCC